jgi:hypothetical protein
MGEGKILAEEQASHCDECHRTLACGGALEEVRTIVCSSLIFVCNSIAELTSHLIIINHSQLRPLQARNA